MENSFVLNGFAEFGGGLFIYKSSIDFNNIVVFNNSGKNTAGGIELFCTKHQSSKPSKINNSHIIKNSGALAGGIYAHEGNILLDNIIIKYNLSSLSCGGISIGQTNKFDLADIRLRNSIVEENLGSVCGGLFCSNFRPILEDMITNSITMNSNNSDGNANFQQLLSDDNNHETY